MTGVVDPAAPRPRERWLRVVREDDAEGSEADAAVAGRTGAPPRPRTPADPARPRPAPPPPGPAAGAPPAERGPARVGPARWVGGPADRRRPRLARSMATLLLVVATGTAGALAADHLVGGPDGEPPLHLLVALALPFWDGLPARLAPRLVVLAATVLAIAAAWLPLAGLRPEPWWRAEVSFGLACALVGTVHLALSARRHRGRTVER